MRIGVVAPSCAIQPVLVDQIGALVDAHFVEDRPEIVFHPQCFLTQGHFAGSDDARTEAFLDYANDPAFDAIWFARGGYGACRVAPRAIAKLGAAAHTKTYMGFSDAGFLLGGLYAAGIGRVVHGPMPADINRPGGDAAVLRSLSWLRQPGGDGAASGAVSTGPSLNLAPPLYPQQRSKPCAAFNLTVLSQLLGTSLEPDLTDHVLMIEEVAEYMYRIDRSLFHVTSNPRIRKVAGIMLGRCNDVPENTVDFGADEEQLIKHWSVVSGIPYLGRANIGHDSANTIVPFG
jgi:muramoyltetrapeptide carboxypeptidase